MKQISSIFFLLITFSFINISQEIYKCSESLKIDTCYITTTEKSGNEDIDITYVKSCPKNKKCHKSTLNYYGDTGICLPKKNYIEEGKECQVSAECQSDYCLNGKCAYHTIGELCKTNYNCDKNSFCNQNICVALYNKGQECTSSNECKIGLYCNINANTLIGICTEVFSLNDGDESSEDFLCKSGHRYQGKCSTTKTIDSTCNLIDGLRQCQISYKYESKAIKTTTPCVGEEEGGYEYCPLQSDSDKLNNYIAIYLDELNKINDKKLDNIHLSTFNRKTMNNNKKVLEAYVNYKYHYALEGVKDESNCIREYFMKLEEGTYLKYSYLFLGIFFLFLLF